jgi:hypothetical protein
MTYFRNFIKLNNADPKPEKVIKEKKSYSFKKKPTGEKEVFEKIWAERPHFCQICFTPIGEASPTNFMHVLAKGLNKYPKFKLNPQNILLACSDCHHIWDHARHKVNQFFNWVFELESSLKEQYKKL